MGKSSYFCRVNQNESLTLKIKLTMFLRFSKGPRIEHNVARSSHYSEPRMLYTKAVFMGDTLVMEYGDSVVGVARLHEESEKCLDYDVIVAGKCELGVKSIARGIKDMIGRSNKFSLTPTSKRRKYYVEVVDCEVLPVKARITLSRV